jgi:glyoxylase I family protein
MTNRAPIAGLHHFAYPCRDAEETRAFYEDLVGLPLVHCLRASAVPSTGQEQEYAHIFFEMADGSCIAFFDLGTNVQPLPSPNVPSWVHHIALQMPTIDDVTRAKARLEAAGINVLGVTDHGFVKSIYFFDPNGLRVELTTRTESEGFLEEVARTAHDDLADWTAQKQQRLAPPTAHS